MKNITYKDAGVDIEAGYEAVNRMKKHVKKTFNENVMSNLGGFGGMFKLPTKYSEPVLISGTDGVGTKLMIAQMMGKHNTIGIDCVAMCVNDIICQGAQPLFFLDYIACGKNNPEIIEEIVKGISTGCIESEMALIGGETAEMPDLYTKEEYDIAGFAVGIVDKNSIITGETIAEGDVLIGLPSSGIHSNGYSLIRKLMFNIKEYDVNTYISDLSKKLGEELLTPTKIYVKTLKGLSEKYTIKGICHITGGGFYENIPRILPEGIMAEINIDKINKLPVFEFIENISGISEKEMYSTFNMGIGMVIVVPGKIVDEVIKDLEMRNESPIILGKTLKGKEGIKICP